MHPESLIARLARTGGELAMLLGEVAPAEATWRPAPGQWSLLEIAAHLLDEEREDFRVRLDHTLHRPGVTWPSIDPPGWVAARRYAARDYAATVAEFRAERAKSLAWLDGLPSPDWAASYRHPQLGELRAGDLLAAWCAHDLLHARQILRRRWERLAELAAPFGTGYAGDWA